MALVPMVVERSDRGERSFDIYSRLLRDRIVFLGTGLDDQVANLITAQLLLLEHDDPERDINLYINSPGGSTTALFGIYDVMQYIRPDVATTCMGWAASGGAVLLAAGTAGKRSALPNARILIHQPWGETGQGQATDIRIRADEMVKQREMMNEILAHHTGKTVDEIARDTERDNIMGAHEAKSYGLIDEVIEASVVAEQRSLAGGVLEEAERDHAQREPRQ